MINYQLSSIKYQVPSIYYQVSTIRYQLPRSIHQASIDDDDDDNNNNNNNNNKDHHVEFDTVRNQFFLMLAIYFTSTNTTFTLIFTWI